jgi:hypothetical protein
MKACRRTGSTRHIWSSSEQLCYDVDLQQQQENSMALGKFFKSLLGDLGSGQPQPVEPVDYKGFSIEAAPIHEDGKYRTAGFISGEVDGEIKRVRFIRADQSADPGTAADHAITKAQQIIDEQGKALLQRIQL